MAGTLDERVAKITDALNTLEKDATACGELPAAKRGEVHNAHSHYHNNT